MPLSLRFRAGTLACALALLSLPAPATELRVATKADPASLDLSANWDLNTINFVLNFYEPLLKYDGKTLTPWLAERWTRVTPTQWRFTLRKDVTFHDGRPLTADDAVFSILRAGAPSSRAKSFVRGITDARAVDTHQFDVFTDVPRPFLLYPLDGLPILSRAWAQENGALQPADVAKNESNAALTSENGTGPYILEKRVPDQVTVARRNPQWWNQEVLPLIPERVVLTPINSDASRVAALLSGEVDIVVPLPVQDVARLERSDQAKLWTGEESRGVFLGFETTSADLKHGQAGSKNPFADARVRRAVHHAINNDALQKVVLRGYGSVANMIVAPGVAGYEADRPRLPHDPTRAKALLAEAGYPDGFDVQLDCTNNRDIGDAATCEAIAPMLARVGIRATPRIRPSTQFLSSLLARDVSFFRFSWGANGWASSNTLFDLFGCKQEGKHGYNTSGYCNAQLDELIARIPLVDSETERDALTRQAWDIVDAEHLVIPLHYPPIFIASSPRVQAVTQVINPVVRWENVRLSR